MNDITTPDDIERLVTTFYGRVSEDDMLGPIFQDVAKVDWSSHLPTMMLFWESLLLKTRKYRGNALQPHLVIFKNFPYRPELMQRWLMLFNETVDDCFQGTNAMKAKHWAKGIGHNLQRQIQNQDK